MSRKWWAALAVAVVAASAFGAGYKVGSDNSSQVAYYTGDCYTGMAVASCSVGEVTYGVNSTVNWTDSGNVGHSDSWPDCLPDTQVTKGGPVRRGVAADWGWRQGRDHRLGGLPEPLGPATPALAAVRSELVLVVLIL